MINSICIVRLSALGDVLMLVPLVRTLQRHFPQARITWVISRPAYDLVEAMEGIEFVVINKPNTLKDYWNFYRSMRARKFDVLLATQASFRANLLYPLIKASRKIGYDALRAKDGHGWFVTERIQPGNDHTVEGFLKFSQPLGIHKYEIKWNLPIQEGHRLWVRKQLPDFRQYPLVLINPAASKPERSWLAERYVAIILYLQKHWQATVYLVGGPTPYDKRLGDEIAAQAPVKSLIGQTKPKQLLALIEAADLLICPDTGPSHMAAAVNTPVVALHAVTGAAVSGPYTFRHLAVDCYSQAVETILQKTPNTNVWGTHAHGPETMKLVTVAAVIEKLEFVFKNYFPSFAKFS